MYLLKYWFQIIYNQKKFNKQMIINKTVGMIFKISPRASWTHRPALEWVNDDRFYLDFFG